MACVPLFRVSATIFYRTPVYVLGFTALRIVASTRFRRRFLLRAVPLSIMTLRKALVMSRESSMFGFDKSLPEMIHESVETAIAGEYLRYVYRHLDAVDCSHQRQIRSLQRDHEA